MASKIKQSEKPICLKDATKAANEATAKMLKLAPKIAKKSQQPTSKLLPDCLQQYDENAKKLESAFEEIKGFQEKEHADIAYDPITIEGVFGRKRSFRISKKSGSKKRDAFPNRKQRTESREGETQYLKRQVSDLERKLNAAKTELDGALCRLSAVASSKLRDNNPNVVELSDQNRPSKIAEQLSELYDYEWTNAYEVLEKNMNDKECCTALLDILLSVYKECNQLATVGFYERIQHSIESPLQSPVEISTKVQMSDYMKQQIKEIRKHRAKYALGAIRKAVAPKIRAEKRDTKAMQAYLNKCIDICWFMVVQDPPLVFTCGSRNTFDTSVFRSYTKRGSHVAFVVWPALLVQVGGSMLSKGIAQGFDKNPRPHSSTYL